MSFALFRGLSQFKNSTKGIRDKENTMYTYNKLHLYKNMEKHTKKHRNGMNASSVKGKRIKQFILNYTKNFLPTLLNV